MHARVLHDMEGVELVAFADIKPEKAQAMVEKYGGVCLRCLQQLLHKASAAGTQLSAVKQILFPEGDIVIRHSIPETTDAIPADCRIPVACRMGDFAVTVLQQIFCRIFS